MLKTLSILLVASTLWSCAGTEPGPEGASQSESPLLAFNGRDLTGFYTFVDGVVRDQDPDQVFSVTPEGWLRISGRQRGYLSTDRILGDYRLVAQFKWGSDDPAADSGIFFHAEQEDRLWATSLEVQMRAGATADLCLIGPGAQIRAGGEEWTKGCVPRPGKGDPDKEIEHPKGEWNEVELVCRGDAVQVKINGHMILEGSSAHVSSGRVYFQSYEGPLFYRKIVFHPL